MTVGHVHSIESMGLVDGPGIRTVIFLQGCALRCRFCHNPDTWELSDGTEYTPEELVAKIRRFKPYFKEDGGVTFSGGEPLLQPDFLKETLKLCKNEGIHTCIDTAGYGLSDYDEILNHTDLVLLDLKHIHKTDYEKIEPLSLMLVDYILLTETPSRLNLTGFQPGLDWVPDVKFGSPKPKKGEVKAHSP